MIGIAAIVVSVALFFADKLVRDEDLAEGLRNALDVAGQVAPWIAGTALAVVAGLIGQAAARTFRRAWETMRTRQRVAEERVRQLEAELEEAKQALKGASAERAQTAAKPERQDWASMSFGVVRLAVPNSELDAMYERATSVLKEHDSELRLTWFEVFVYPYHDPPNHVAITLTLYSYRSGRDYSFWMTDDGDFSEDRTGRRTLEHPEMFERLPWREQPEWCDVLNVAAARAAPLIADADTTLAIMTGPPSPPLEWSVYVKDYGARRQLDFRGSSAADIRQWPS